MDTKTQNVTAAKQKKLAPLKSSRDFDFVNRKGKSFQARFVRIVVLSHNLNKQEAPRPSRLGITISKKIHKHAVLRNRFRRRIKELFRTKLHPFFIGHDIHVIARPGSFEASSAELSDEIMRLVRNITNNASK